MLENKETSAYFIKNTERMGFYIPNPEPVQMYLEPFTIIVLEAVLKNIINIYGRYHYGTNKKRTGNCHGTD
jgi:hypothetical protein